MFSTPYVLVFLIVRTTTAEACQNFATRLEELEARFVRVSSENHVLWQKIDDWEKKNEQLIARVAVLENHLLKQNLSGDGEGLNKRLLSSSSIAEEPLKVAFHANVNGHIGLNDNEMIKFDRGTLNLGSAYDSHIGLFQCPTPGYYVFFAHFLVFAQKRLEAQIVKDGAVIQQIFAGTQDVGNGPGSNVVIVHLNQGDRVWVRVHDKYHDTGDILDGSWCTFAGFLLYPDA